MPQTQATGQTDDLMWTMTDPREALPALTFRLRDETFALGIESVREVVEHSVMTRVPRSSPYVKGLVSLRGTVIPIVDLRERLGLGTTAQTVDTRIVVMEVQVSHESTVVGALADEVLEVTTLSPESAEDIPSYGLELSAEVLDGLAQHRDQLVLILDPIRVFSDIQIPRSQAAAGSSGPGILGPAAAAATTADHVVPTA